MAQSEAGTATMQNDVELELERDLACLAAAESAGTVHFRVWRTVRPTVVIGRAVACAREVDEGYCRATGIPIVERPSGGRSVLVGPGTVQYTFALPHALADELRSIASAKRFCNALVIAGLAAGSAAGAADVAEDPSGDLVRGGRKLAGLALRRVRTATLLHGTVLVDADLALIARALKHPEREPTYRRGRSHRDFLANLGTLDERILESVVRAKLATIAQGRRRT